MAAIARLPLFLALVASLRVAAAVLTVISSEKTLSFTAAEFTALPHTEVVATDPHVQKKRLFSGVPVSELLTRADAPLGDKLRGDALRLAVVARGKDGYVVFFARADFDEAFSGRTILLAETEDGELLPDNAAPFRLITPGDKNAAHWARMITSIELVRVGEAAARQSQ